MTSAVPPISAEYPELRPGRSSGAADSDTVTPTNNRLVIALGLLSLVYIASSISAIRFYSAAQCPYTDKHTCEEVNLAKCGANVVFSPDDCADFTHKREPCFCTECQSCYSETQLKFCAKPAAEREAICRNAGI
jgi:hypothetical protein